MERPIGQSNHRPQTVTDEEGRFRIDTLSPGEWAVRVDPERHAAVMTIATASRETLARLERLDAIALLAELGLLVAVRANLGPTLGRPLRRSTCARVSSISWS